MSDIIHTFVSGLLAPIPGLCVTDLATDTTGILITLTATTPSACCPDCTTPTTRIHSRYQRSLADVPWASQLVRLRVRVRKFFCCHHACARRIFTERLPDLAPPSARKTQRLDTALRTIGMALGGIAGARLATQLQMPISPTTMQRLVCTTPLPSVPPLQAIGIDEWAWRRGQRYGTIIVNLVDHHVVDLLPDRAADTVAVWLRQHPTITVVCRDRSELYADGI